MTENETRARHALDRRDDVLRQLLDLERRKLVAERTTGLARKRLDRLPAGHPERATREARLDAAAGKSARLTADGRSASAEYDDACRSLTRRAAKLSPETRSALGREAAEREVGAYLKATEKADTPLARAGMRTILRFNADRNLHPGRAAAHSFRVSRAADLSHPVRLRTVEPGERLIQFAHPNSRRGESYTLPGTAPDRCGISPEVVRPRQIYVARERVRGLEFTAAPTMDTWTMRNPRGERYSSYAAGGATEIHLPRERVRRALDRVPKSAPPTTPDAVASQKAKIRERAAGAALRPAVSQSAPDVQKAAIRARATTPRPTTPNTRKP